MSYRKSNDNWKQLLLKLDELGEKPWFIHTFTTNLTNEAQDFYRCSPRTSGKTPVVLFDTIGFRFWALRDDTWDRSERIYYKLLKLS